MSYHIRYVLTDTKELTLPEIEEALQQVKPGYSLDEDTLLFDGKEYGQIEINAIGDGIFEDDMELLERFAQKKQSKDALLSILAEAKSMVTVQPIWSDRDDDKTLEVLEPLFDWLVANRVGILANEDGTFFNSAGHIE